MKHFSPTKTSSINSKRLRYLMPLQLVFILFIFIQTYSVNAEDVVCSINCPSTVEAATASGLCDVVVNYPAITTTGSCGILSYSIPDGSVFPVGTTPVTVTSQSGETCSFNVHVTATPLEPGLLQGPEVICRGVSYTYCVPPIQGAVSYTWTLPAGVTGSSNTNCITVTFGSTFTSGVLLYSALSGCGSGGSHAKIIDAALTKPAKPAAINGPSPTCAGTSQIYCASFVPNVETWVFTIAGNGGNAPLTIVQQIGSCVTLNIPAGYNGKQQLKVKGINCMGVGEEQKLDIKVLDPPNMPGNITGPATICHSQIGFYSVNNVNGASQYNWSVSNGVWIAGGQGTTNVALDFVPSTATSSLLSVTAQNACGISAPRTKNITINTACREGADETFANATASPDANLYPNPTSGKVMLEYISNETTNYSLKVYDMTGRVVLTRELISAEGLNLEELDLSGFAKQIYLIRLENENGTRTLRIAVE